MRYYLAGSGNWYGNADAYADGSSTLFGPGGPGTGTPAKFGRSDVAITPSGGMTADMLRGSAFYTFEAPGGVATALYAYMDGRGGGSGSQQVRMVMYLDPINNDVDHPVIVSDAVTIAAGAPAGWVRFPIPVTYLPEGGYRLMIHSGPNAAVARYYIDGSYENWSNMYDAFADGPPPVYSPATFGAGTVSAYVGFTEFHPQ